MPAMGGAARPVRRLAARPKVVRYALACGVLATLLLFLPSYALFGANAQPQPAPLWPTPTLPQYHPDLGMGVPNDLPLEARQMTREVAASPTTVELPTGIVSVDGQPLPTSAYAHDSLLALMPDFAFSMPAQIVVTGINVALVAVLLVHLLFTVQYHFPLSKRNFNLQISSSIMLLVSLSVTLHIILTQLQTKSQSWPYMFPYIGVQVPPGDDSWTMVQDVFYLLMRAITTLLIHVTHIQFLTLLFPSALEARLILWMLGPLAIVNSGMEFTALSSDDDFKTSDLGDAIRNICNSTLTLLYTSALLIWGTLVNRRRAWRAGGGTTAFGGGSVGLAIINTAISFIEIKFDRLWWLPNVCWTLTIWQSWLGFWWWVSSGMGIGEVEDRQEKLEKKRKREMRRRRKADRQRKKAAGLVAEDEDGGDGGGRDAEDGTGFDSSSIPGLNGIRRFTERMIGDGSTSTAVRRQRRAAGQPGAEHDQDLEHIELRQIRIATNSGEASLTLAGEGSGGGEAEPGLQGVAVDGEDGDGELAEAGEIADDARTTVGTGSGSSDTNPTTAASSTPPGWLGLATQRLMDRQPNFIKARFRRLRLAHVAAAKRAATEQSVLREQVLNSSRSGGPGLRHMMFDRTSSVHGGVEPGGSNSGGGLAGSTNVSRRNSNIIRSSSTGARSNAADDRGPSSRRTSRGGGAGAGAGNGSRADDVFADGGGTASANGYGSPSSRLHLSRITSEGHYSSNDTSATRVDPPTTLSGSGISLQATVNESSNRHHGQRHPLASAGHPGSCPAEDDWVDDYQPTNRHGRSSAAHADDGSDAEAYGDEDDENAETSWFWRGGLRKMRLRDRTRYD